MEVTKNNPLILRLETAKCAICKRKCWSLNYIKLLIKLLSNVIPVSDIVNYCILPYLGINKKEIDVFCRFYHYPRQKLIDIIPKGFDFGFVSLSRRSNDEKNNPIYLTYCGKMLELMANGKVRESRRGHVFCCSSEKCRLTYCDKYYQRYYDWQNMTPKEIRKKKYHLRFP